MPTFAWSREHPEGTPGPVQASRPCRSGERIAVRDALNGRTIDNTDALANPEASSTSVRSPKRLHDRGLITRRS